MNFFRACSSDCYTLDFVEKGGLKLLMDVISRAKGKILCIALICLRSMLTSVRGCLEKDKIVKEFKGEGGLSQLYELLLHPNTKVNNHSRLLIAIVKEHDYPSRQHPAQEQERIEL